MNEALKSDLEIWGGIECSYNRIGDQYMDQLELSGHYERQNDIVRFARLGIKALRYPVLWEKHCPEKGQGINWKHTRNNLNRIKELNIIPIAGLVHHGSGPVYTNFYDDSFATGLAEFASKVAVQFPWLEYYTPVNEPLTTARFCGLYGHWYPHGKSDEDFLRILLTECKAVVLCMKEILKVNPHAKLVQTEDLGKTHSTSKLKYQADFENRRRWLSLDLLCGKVNLHHPLYPYLRRSGISASDLLFFHENPCKPHIIGINHYITSERYIDENRLKYPRHTWGSNKRHRYADVESVRVGGNCVAGPYQLLKEAWERFSLPLAVTEVHLHCTREEQLRWFYYIWKAASRLKNEGADIKAITAWAILGSFDWCSLLTRRDGIYEPGAYDLRTPEPRATALAGMIRTFAQGKVYNHPVLEEDGWWQRNCRVLYNQDSNTKTSFVAKSNRPVLITGKTGTLGKAFGRICGMRGIHHLLLDRNDCNITNTAEIENAIIKYKPWAIINTAGFVKVDEAETDTDNCFLVNSLAPQQIASHCSRYQVKFMTFSSDLVFDGKKNDPYLESDIVSPLNVYGQSKAKAEKAVLTSDTNALIIRTSAFFGPWDAHNFVVHALSSFKNNVPFSVANDVIISPTYVPDLVHIALDLLLDDESGIWNISNQGELSWAMLAEEVAKRAHCTSLKLCSLPVRELGLIAPRPHYSVLNSEKCFELPSLDNALERFFKEQQLITLK